MQKISESTNTANPAGEFTEGNPAAGAPATLLKAAWLNTIQRELAGLVLGAGISLNANDDAQVLKAVKALAGTAADFNKLANKPTTLSGYGITDGITAAQMNAALTGKASKATTLGGYGITDAVSSNNDNAVVGKISDVTRAQFINGNPVAATTDLPAGVSYFSGFRAKYNGGKLGFDFGCSMTERRSFGRLTLADGTGDWFEYWTNANFDPSQKANLAGPSFSGTPTAPTAAAGSNSSQLANTAFVWSAVNTYATTVNASLAAKADKATSLLVGSPSQQRPELAAPAGGDDWPASALIIREAGLVANTQTANFYAPGIAFHWGAVIAKKLFMDAVGVLRWAGKALLTTDSIAAPAEVDAGASGSVLVTPWTLLLGFNFVRGTNGAIVFPNWLGRFIIQWGVTSSIGNGAAAAFNYPIAFPNAAVCPGAFRRGTGNNSPTVETNLTQITITNRPHYSNDSSATANVYFFFCIGY